MNAKCTRSAWIAAGMLWALASGAPAVADDTELFVVDASLFPEARPNVLFVMDTSGSMDDEINTQPTYEPGTAYDGTCLRSRVYWRTDTGGTPPACSTNNYVNNPAFTCNAAMVAFRTAGFYIDVMAQYDTGSDKRWETLSNSQHDRFVECEDDAGLHGDGIDASKVYARNGNTSQLWTSDSGNKITWGTSPANTRYRVYDGNYLNWYYNARLEKMKKIDIVKDVAKDLLDTVNGINVGLMRYNSNGSAARSGGAVIYAMEDIATARANMKAAIDGLPAAGNTPLAETMYEAALYYRGLNVYHGNATGEQNSVAAARLASNTNQYKTPVEFGCQKNFVIYLSDGEPTSDNDDDALINTMVGHACDGTNCLDDVTEYLHDVDISPAPGGLPGLQTVVTHTIGFAQDIPILKEAAEAGNDSTPKGKYFQANNTAELSSALSNIVADILDTQTTFVSPTVSVNSFNRTQNLNDLYITMFKPTGDYHWPGNLKKYKLDVDTTKIVDANDQPAVAGAFFATTAQSFWSDTVDGASVTTGGAASKIPAPASRNVWTCLGCGNGDKLSSYVVETGNAAITDVMLNLGQPDSPRRDDLFEFIRGGDVKDTVPSSSQRNEMGDPLHAQPATVMYNASESVVYFPTNDGYLHAIDTKTGTERWVFIPQEFLGDMVSLYENESVAKKHFGLDGSPRLQIIADNNGTIDVGTDHVYLFFGMRRGGDTVYALDVTDPANPQFMWKKASADLPTGLGQSWSNPVPARVDISDGTYGAGNTSKSVVIFGAGYDAGHDQPALPTTPDDGNGIVIVDSVGGNVLWHVKKGGGNIAGTTMPNMNYSFASDIRVVDLDGDGLSDKMFASDMGGQVWRFDLRNGSTRAAFATGGMIAQLGGAPLVGGDPTYANNRRFYYAPDVALASKGNQSFIHIGIGSGHRESPNSTLNHDRFYALRDYSPFTTLTQTQFNLREATPITEADLIDIRDNLSPTFATSTPAGWRMELREGNTWKGEKVLAEARTFANRVFFTTFTPGVSATANDCTPRLGTNRLYVVDLFTGRPVTNLDQSADPTNLTVEDRRQEFEGSIASEVVFLFPSPEDPTNCVGDQCTPDPVACVDLFCFPPGFSNDPIRTFWSEETVD